MIQRENNELARRIKFGAPTMSRKHLLRSGEKHIDLRHKLQTFNR
jgi:hypothetical protein